MIQDDNFEIVNGIIPIDRSENNRIIHLTV